MQRAAKLETPKQFRGNGDALIVWSLLQEGLRGVHDMLYSNEISRHRAERHRTGTADTLSFLVQFAIARRQVGSDRDSWQPFYEEMCHRQAELNKSFRGRTLPQAERVALRIFLVELADWLVPEVLRQVKA